MKRYVGLYYYFYYFYFFATVYLYIPLEALND